MTSLIRYPFNFDLMFPTDIFNEVWKSFDSESLSKRMSQGFPKYDQYLEDGNKVIEIALAGYSKNQLVVEVDDNTLTISANKVETSKSENRVLARRSFTKSLTDHYRIWNLEAAEVSFVDGMLKVVLPPNKPLPAAKKVLAIK